MHEYCTVYVYALQYCIIKLQNLVVLPVQQEVQPNAPLSVRRRVVVENEPMDEVLDQRPQQNAEQEHRQDVRLADHDAYSKQHKTTEDRTSLYSKSTCNTRYEYASSCITSAYEMRCDVEMR